MFYECVFVSHFLDQVANSNEKDSWEDADNSANNTPATTPEEEENSIDNDSTYVPASKPRTKVRPEVKEAFAKGRLWALPWPARGMAPGIGRLLRGFLPVRAWGEETSLLPT